jgi:hypothetical protein
MKYLILSTLIFGWIFFAFNQRTKSNVSANDQIQKSELISNFGDQDSLALFPLGSWMKFVNINANDQIALLFKRNTLNTFQYRIELLRKWKGLPHDLGVLHLQKIEADSIYIFSGGNSDCEVRLKIYNDKGKFQIGKAYVKLERNCKNDALDIAVDEFRKLFYK